MRLMHIFSAALFFALIATPGARAAKTGDIVVTIKPLHSLVQGVIGETGEARLLVAGAASVHGFSLKPSQVKALQEARAVFYIDETLEEFLKNALLSLPDSVRKIPLVQADGISLLKRRAGGAWDDHDHASGHSHNHSSPNGAPGAYAGYNPHLWLDPENAIHITETVAATLGEIYPENAAIYAENAARQIARLKILDEEIAARLAAVRGIPFVVLHDAYPYFEARYGLTAVGSLTIEPDAPSSARKLADIREKLRSSGARCLFREPQFSDRLLLTAAEDLPVKIGVLDPLGADIPADEALYFSLMMTLTDGFLACLRS